jgi:hypothetical protein
MLFRLEDDEWHPTGRWCLTTPFTMANRPEGGDDGGAVVSGIQRDPDGWAWHLVGGEWRLSAEGVA